MIIGPSPQNMTGALGRNRYYQNLLNYTMVFPEDWVTEETTTTVTATAPENQASLNVEVQRLQENKEPRLFISENLGIPDLQQSEALAQFGLPGYTGLVPGTGQRIAVIYYAQRAFVFRASTQTENLNSALMESIKSFRPIARNEGIFANPVQVAWFQSDGQARYSDLARASRIPEFPEETLRLMNGDYPAGEPKAGQWVKIAN